jgi:hypothetical protein
MRTETHGTGCLIDDYSFILLSILPPYIGGVEFLDFWAATSKIYYSIFGVFIAYQSMLVTLSTRGPVHEIRP